MGSVPPPAAPHPVLRRYYARARDRESFVTALFDGAASQYDRLCGVMALGSGQRYRRQALLRAGIRRGMTVLDVGTGTGLLARAALDVLDASGGVTGIDPSGGMLREARGRLSAPLVQGRGEALPFAPDHFDLVAMGYALRHVADLDVAFREYLRVLKPGGRLLLLDTSRPQSAAGRWLIRTHLRHVLPFVMWLATGSDRTRVLTRYFWETIATCVPAEAIVTAMHRTGFVGIEHHVAAGCLSEYVATKPARATVPSPGGLS